MDRVRNLEAQRRFVAEKQGQGLKRVVLWARPEDVGALKEIAGQPHAVAQHLAELRARIERELAPQIRAEVAAKLRRRTERAMLVQRRAEGRQRPVEANRPPECIRFTHKPPAATRARLKAAGWLYDPVAALWHLPDDPALWEATERLLASLAHFPYLALAKPLTDAP
jgi:hypothetical protein